MEKKYYLDKNLFKQGADVILFRIIALKSFGNVRKGETGGWIESEHNLSQEGNAWVYGDAKVFGDAWVGGNAQVYGDARVFGDALVYGNAKVYEDAKVSGNAKVYGNAWVGGDARVYGNAEATTKVINIIEYNFNITKTDNALSIGCKWHLLSEWRKLLKNDPKLYKSEVGGNYNALRRVVEAIVYE